MPSPLEQASDCISQARSLAVLTGAGISAESGVPTFRGAGGLWKDYKPEELPTPEAFARDPRLGWGWDDTPHCACGGMARPGVVCFGEPLPEGMMKEAEHAVAAAQVFLVIGTSAVVY